MVCEEGRAGGDLTIREANTFPDCNLRLSQPEHILSRLLHTLIKLRVLQRAYAESNVSDWSNSLFTPRRPPRELRAGWRRPRRRNRLHPNPVFPHLIKPCVPTPTPPRPSLAVSIVNQAPPPLPLYKPGFRVA